MTFGDLVRSCPAIAELQADARSIAQHARWDWYEKWLPGTRIFHAAVRSASDRLTVDADVIRPVALAGLIDVYEVTKRRRAR